MLFYFFSLFSFSLDLSLLFSFFFYKFVENTPRISNISNFDKGSLKFQDSSYSVEGLSEVNRQPLKDQQI